MSRRRFAVVSFALAAAALVATMAARRMRARSFVHGRDTGGGRLMDDAATYDLGSRLLFGPLFARIAADVAAAVPGGASVLEVGCGPGHLSVRMARDHDLRVTASDLDPAMVERARRSVERSFEAADPGRPVLVQADVAALPFEDGMFDAVVSTFSMHHWADPDAGLAEIHRVLRPGGRALIWDFSRRVRWVERHSPEPLEVAARSPFASARSDAWRWPGPLRIAERVELVRGRLDGASAQPASDPAATLPSPGPSPAAAGAVSSDPAALPSPGPAEAGPTGAGPDA